MRVIGLTGGIATGKSTVARILRERGVPVIDADLVARQVVEPGEPALQALVEALGPGILASDGTLDRAAMRARISRDEAARRTLNGITHPAILGRIAHTLQGLAARGEPVAVVEAALMVESGSWRSYGDLLVVTCDPQVQLVRLMARDGATEADARALVATQLPLAEKEAVATEVIRNDGDATELERAVDAAWARLLAKPG